jgi:D-tyrosyl-tRNA(Tyr) deacylase
MRAVVQRVSRARVLVAEQVVGAIETGLCVLVGVGEADTEADARQLAAKVSHLRVFEDPDHKMNLSVLDAGGAVLAISQFTLFGDARRGNRPSFTAAREPLRARQLFDEFCRACRASGPSLQTGRFGAHMQVELTNDGPVTVLLDTQKLF